MSSTYPITVESQSFDHHGGTKSYHLVMIQTSDGRCLVVNRWGKKGAWGELEVKQFDTVPAALKRWDSKEREKTKRGYSPTTIRNKKVANDQSELTKAIGISLVNSIAPADVTFLDPTFDTSGMREPPANRTEDGELRHTKPAETRNAKFDAEELERARLEKAAAAAAAAEQAYEQHENFGRF